MRDHGLVQISSIFEVASPPSNHMACKSYEIMAATSGQSRQTATEAQTGLATSVKLSSMNLRIVAGPLVGLSGA